MLLLPWLTFKSPVGCHVISLEVHRTHQFWRRVETTNNYEINEGVVGGGDGDEEDPVRAVMECWGVGCRGDLGGGTEDLS